MYLNPSQILTILRPHLVLFKDTEIVPNQLGSDTGLLIPPIPTPPDAIFFLHGSLIDYHVKKILAEKKIVAAFHYFCFWVLWFRLVCWKFWHSSFYLFLSWVLGFLGFSF